MRTLKRTLCIVLALVLTLGLCVLSVSAKTDFSDDAQINTTYGKAATILNKLKVFEGENNYFRPGDPITRGEVAAVLYRLVTGDVDKKQVGIYVDWNKFDDVKSTDWYAGYIGYVANGEMVKGYGDGNFGPTDQVTGYQVLAMLLRAIGYGQNKEFEGDGWDLRTATTARGLGITKNISESTLGSPATRERVAEMVFQAMLVPQVSYQLGMYNKYTTLNGSIPNATLGFAVFGLVTKPEDTMDDWGAPLERWYYKAKTVDDITDAKAEKLVDIDIPAKYEIWHAEPQCDISDAIGLETKDDFTVYVNGKDNKTGIEIDATRTDAKIGAQGRWTRVWYDKNGDKRVVYVDTVLAEVVNVTAPTFDPAGHVITQARLTMRVFTSNTNSSTGGTLVYKDQTKGATWSYAKGDMLLVNYYQSGLSGASDVNVSGFDTVGARIKGYTGASNAAEYEATGKNVTIKEPATSIDGSQTIKSWNLEKHTVGGTDYNDNNRFHLNEAQLSTGTHTWYFDSTPEGRNLIGNKAVKTSGAYGVITRLWTNISNGTATVKANVTYIDGSTATLDMNQIVVFTGAVSTAVTATGSNIDYGTAVYNNDNTTSMTLVSGSTLYVSDSYSENLNKNSTGGHNIIGDHMFLITANTNGTYNFAEVGGAGAGNAKVTVAPNVDYTGMGNANVEMIKGQPLNGGAVLVNGSTRFLIKTGGSGTDASPFTFSTAVGSANIVDYVNGEVDYVDVDGDTYADYVYITASPKSTAGDHIFFTDAYLKSDLGGSGNTWGLKYERNQSTGVYTVYGWLDGTYGSVKIAAGTIGGNTISQSDVDAFIAAEGYNMWTLTITGGYVTDIDGKRNDSSSVKYDTAADIGTYGAGGALDGAGKGMNDAGATYKDKSLIVYNPSGTGSLGNGTTETLNGEFLKLGGSYFNITGVTPYVGQWTDAIASGSIVYLVYNKINQVEQAYIVRSTNGSSYNTSGTAAYTWSATTATYSSGTTTINATVNISGDTYNTETVEFRARLEASNNAGVSWNTLKTADTDSISVSSGAGSATSSSITIDYGMSTDNATLYRVYVEFWRGGKCVAVWYTGITG